MNEKKIAKIFGWTANVLILAVNIPQIIHNEQHKSTCGINKVSTILSIVISLLWIVYGKYTKDVIIMVSGIINLIISIIITIQKIKYDEFCYKKIKKT